MSHNKWFEFNFDTLYHKGISVEHPCCITVVCAYHQWPVVFQQTRVPNSLLMGVNYVDYEPQRTEVIQVCLQTTP